MQHVMMIDEKRYKLQESAQGGTEA